MTKDDETTVLLVLLAMATALWLVAWAADGPAADPEGPGLARGGAAVATASP